MPGDDELTVDFGKVGDWFKRKKKPDVKASDQQTRKSALSEPIVEQPKESLLSDKHAVVPHAEHPEQRKTGDDEITIDFKKFAGFFKKKGDNSPEVKDELGFDFSRAWNWVKAHPVLVVLVLLLILQFFPTRTVIAGRDWYFPWGGMWMRSEGQELPATAGWAQNHVFSILKGQLQNEVNKQYPNLPDERKNKIIDEQWQKVYTEQKAQIDQQIQQVAQQIKAFWQYEHNGRQYTYMPNIDPYNYLRYARNILEKGHIEDERKDGQLWDNHMNSPFGGEIVPELQVYALVWINRLMNIFGSQIPLMQSSGYLNIIFILLAMIPAFFVGRRFGGLPGGIVAATMIAVMPSIISRTAWDADTDVWNVFFPVLLTWMYVLMIDAEDTKGMVGYGILGGFVTGMYAFAWRGGWWYVFDFMTAAFGILVLSELVFTARKGKSVIGIIKKRAMLAIPYAISSLIFVSLLVDSSYFFSALLQPVHFTVIKAAAHPTLWPNVYTTVAELNPTNIAGAVGTIGGWLYFWIAVAGIALLLVRRSENGWKLELKHAPLLALWFVATLYASTKGVRFTLLLAPAFALAFGIALGRIYQWVVRVSTQDLRLNPKIAHAVMIVIIAMMLSSQARGAYATSSNNIPIMNDAWWNQLTAIKEDSKPHGVINSWWDFGHQFKFVADRPVTFDGASQNTPMAHWIGRVLTTSNETEAVGILRMLDCGSNSAFEALNAEVGEPVKSVKLLYQIIGVSKDAAHEILARNNIPSDKVLQFTHCDPPENYFIASDDMIGKSGVWSHFGLWNFERAKLWIVLRHQDKDSAVQEMVRDWGYTQEKAEELYFQAQSLANENDANAWISPWLGILGAADCSRNADEITCANGVRRNLTSGDITISVQGGTGKPPMLVEMKEDGRFVETRYNGSNVGIAVILAPNGPESYKSVLASPELIASIFVKLYFLEGHGLKYFKEFNRQQFLTGGQTIAYKIDWTGSVSKTFSGLEALKNAEKKAAEAKEGDTVSVYYIGALENGAVFDSSIKDWQKKNITIDTSLDGQELAAPLQFVVGGGQMIPGFDAAVRGMAQGDEQVVRIPPNAAYGLDPAKHPLGNQTLKFKIRLVTIEPKK